MHTYEIWLGKALGFKIRKIPSEKCMKNLICIKCVSYHSFTLEKIWLAKKLKIRYMRTEKNLEIIFYLKCCKYAKCKLEKSGLGKIFKIRIILSEKIV